MNYYNPLSSLLSNFQPLMTPPVQAINQRPTNMGNHFNSLAYDASASLNQKRHFDALGEVNMGDLEALMWGTSKKIKPNQGPNAIDANTISLLRNMNEINNNSFAPRNSFVPQKNAREVINLEDDDDVIPMSNPMDFYRSQGNPSVNLQAINMANPNYLPNLLNQNNLPWGNQYNSSASMNLLQGINSWNRTSLQDLMVMEQYKQNQSAQLLQQLLAKEQQTAMINQSLIAPQHNGMLASQLSMLRPLKQNLISEAQSTPKTNFITIDEDEQIPQQKPQKKANEVGFRPRSQKTSITKSASGFQAKQSPSKKIIDLAVKAQSPQEIEKEKPVVKTITKIEAEPQEQIKGDTTESVTTQATFLWQEPEASSETSESGEYNSTDIYAVIPEFELTEPRDESRVRKPKLVWKPDSEEAEIYRNCSENIEKIVAMQITSELKLIETLRKYNMNPQEAYEKIKRNKASYKIYFKVQKLKRGEAF